MYYLQLHVVSQSLNWVQVNSGLTNEKQPTLLPHFTFNPKSVWQHSLYMSMYTTTSRQLLAWLNITVLQQTHTGWCLPSGWMGRWLDWWSNATVWAHQCPDARRRSADLTRSDNQKQIRGLFHKSGINSGRAGWGEAARSRQVEVIHVSLCGKPQSYDKVEKNREAEFRLRERQLLLETHKDVKHKIQKKGNMATVIKCRENVWQITEDWLNVCRRLDCCF